MYHVFINYGDGVDCGIWHYSSQELAKQHIVGVLAQRIQSLEDENDSGQKYSELIASELLAEDVDSALHIYNNIEGNLESIDYQETVILEKVDDSLVQFVGTLKNLVS